MEQNNPLIEATAEFLSRDTSSKVNHSLKEGEDDAVTKHVTSKHPEMGHLASEGSHHIYAAQKGSGIKYIHHDSSTGKTTNLGTHGRNATESNYSDMRLKMEKHGIKISDKTDKKLSDFHDSTI